MNRKVDNYKHKRLKAMKYNPLKLVYKSQIQFKIVIKINRVIRGYENMNSNQK